MPNFIHVLWLIVSTWYRFLIYMYVHVYMNVRINAHQIYRLRHQAIIEVKGLFVGSMSKKFYLQMPWYEHGTLCAWASGDQRPKWPQVYVLHIRACKYMHEIHARTRKCHTHMFHFDLA